jgi:hypothetical protein
VYCHFFFSKDCACDICNRSHLSAPPWLGSHGVYSPTAPIAPSLRALVPSSSLIRCQSVQVCHHHPPLPICESNSSESGQSMTLILLCRLFFRFGGGWPLHNVHSLIFCSLMEGLTVCFATSSPVDFLKILPDVLSFLRRSYSFKSRSLIPLLPSWHIHCLLSSIWPLEVPLAILSLVRFFIVSVQLSVLYNRIPYTVPLLQGRSCLCVWQPTSSRTHHCPRSVSAAVSGTLQLDASPHTTSSVLWQFSLQPLL